MAIKPPPGPTVSGAVAVMQKALSRGRGRRSPVMVWMQQNRVELEVAFAETAPAWDALASYLGSHGIMDGEGKPPTAQAARAAWRRVKIEAEAKAKVSAAPVAPVASVMPAIVEAGTAARSLSDRLSSAAAGNPQPVTPPRAEGAPPAPHPRFGGPATLRNHTPGAPLPPPAPPMPTVPTQDAAAVIEAFRARGRSPGFRPPEPEPEDE